MPECLVSIDSCPGDLLFPCPGGYLEVLCECECECVCVCVLLYLPLCTGVLRPEFNFLCHSSALVHLDFLKKLFFKDLLVFLIMYCVGTVLC